MKKLLFLVVATIIFFGTDRVSNAFLPVRPDATEQKDVQKEKRDPQDRKGDFQKGKRDWEKAKGEFQKGKRDWEKTKSDFQEGKRDWEKARGKFQKGQRDWEKIKGEFQKGKRGPQGPKGDFQKGKRGPQGTKGDFQKGKRGPQGPKADFQKGTRGPQGPKGDFQKGKRGPQGPKGDVKKPGARFAPMTIPTPPKFPTDEVKKLGFVKENGDIDVEKLIAKASELIKAADQNGDGVIDKEERQKAKEFVVKRAANYMMKRAVKDQKGKEFKKGEGFGPQGFPFPRQGFGPQGAPFPRQGFGPRQFPFPSEGKFNAPGKDLQIPKFDAPKELPEGDKPIDESSEPIPTSNPEA